MNITTVAVDFIINVGAALSNYPYLKHIPFLGLLLFLSLPNIKSFIALAIQTTK